MGQGCSFKRMRLPQALGALSERPFRFQFLAGATSVIGDTIVDVALVFAVLRLTGSAGDLGAVLAARTVTLVVFVLIGGVWADRVPRQWLMAISDVGRFATQGTLGVLLVTGQAELWHFFVLESINGAATAFFQPAQIGLTPQTISPARLQQANALLSFTWSAGSIIGPALGGIIVVTVGPGWGLIIDALTFALSAYFLTQIRLPKEATYAPRKRFLRELADGWHEVRSRTWVWVSILNFMLFQLLMLPTFFVLGPVIAQRDLGGAKTWALILAMSGIGAVLGDLLALRLEPKRPLRVTFLIMLICLPAMFLLGARAAVPLIAIASVPWGVSFSFGNTLWFTALQDHIPEAAISRVSSFDWIGSTVLRPIGFAVVGPISETLGLAATFIWAATIMGTVEVLTSMVPSVANLPRKTRAVETASRST